MPEFSLLISVITSNFTFFLIYYLNMKFKKLSILSFVLTFFLVHLIYGQSIVPSGLGRMSVVQPTRTTAILSGNLLQNGGQNPTVKIVWGDEDRGTSPTPSIAWDNEVIISTNQAPGSFSTTITIPNLDKIYYFRSLVSNAGGAAVSRELGILNPSAPVGKANLQGRWNFDASNANDVSGKNRHGTAKELFSPSEISGMKLWLDAADDSTITHSSNAVSQWSDTSGNNNHASQSTSTKQPALNAAPQNGLSTIKFDGTNDYLSVTSLNITQAYSFYAVAKTTVGSGKDYLFDGRTTDSVRSLVALNNAGKVQSWAGTGWANSNIYTPSGFFTIAAVFNSSNSQISINGTTVSSLNPGTRNLTNGIYIGTNYLTNADFLEGEIGEFVIINGAASTTDLAKMEGYLAHKWGLSGALSSSHAYKLGAPVAGSGTLSYINDTPFGSGKAVDLTNGHIEVIAGGTEDSFDGGSAFSVSAWVKGWPNQFGKPIVSKGGSVPSPTDVPSLSLWLDASDTSTMDQGTSAGAIGPPSSGNLVKYWADKSGNGIVFTSNGSPKFEGSALNSDYPGVNTDLGNFSTSGGQIIDGWNSMTFFMVFDWLDTSNWEYLLWKGNPNSGHGFRIQKMNVGANQGSGCYVPRHADNGGGQDRAYNSILDARSSTKILTLTYDGPSKTIKLYGNGVSASTKTNAKNDLGSSTGSAINLGNDQRYGDILIYRNSLSNADREHIEGFLALKYGMVNQLPATHSGKPVDGWLLGSGIGNDLAANLDEVGNLKSGSSTVSPTTDNAWHHVVSTYDGGTRKLYLDGTEVSSGQATGNISSTGASLVFGAIDMNSSAGGVAASKHTKIKLDDVRVYNAGLSSTQVAELYNNGNGDLNKVGDFNSVADINGTSGSALSTTVSANITSPVYEAINLTPGLSINSSTGEISGTPTVGGDRKIIVVARNSAGMRASTILQYKSPASDPLFAFPTLSPSSDHAVVIGEVSHSGGEENIVDLFWSSNSTRVNTQYSDLNNLQSGSSYNYQNYLPNSSSSLKIWLAADDNTSLFADSNFTTTATGTVAGWKDKSGNDNHLLSQGNPSTASRNHNGKNVIDFDGDDYFETSAVYASGVDFSFFMVAGIDAINNANDSIFAIRQEAGDPSFQIDAENTSAFKIRFWRTGMGTGKTFASSAQHGPSIYEFIFNDATNLLEVFQNGTSLGTTAYTASPNQGNKLTVFTNRGKSAAPDGFVAEMIGLVAIPTTERQNIEGYLAHKWGLTSSLPNAHPYKSTQPLAWSSSFQESASLETSAARVGSGMEGFYGTTISDLTAGETYYYRLRSTNKSNAKGIMGTNLKLWLDGSDTASVSQYSNTVTSWNDKSGNGFQLQSFGAPSTGTRSLDGKNVIDFDGDDYFESATGYPTGNDFSFLMVAGIDAINHVNDSIFCIRQSTAQPSFQIDSGDTSAFKIRFTPTDMGTAKTFATSAKHGPSIYEFVFKDSTNLLEVFLNGSSLGTTAYTAVPNQSNKLLIFANRATDQRPDGFVAEMIGLSTALSNTNRAKLEGYLAHKWGLENKLPGTHTYRSNVPTSRTSWSAVPNTV